jgi:hypothetical protein
MLFAILLVVLLPAAAGAQEGVSCEEEVVVAKDDWLSKYADKYFGNVLSWPAIMAWTNQAAAAEPDKYARIENADVIAVGWTVCIPSAEDAEAFLADYDPGKPSCSLLAAKGANSSSAVGGRPVARLPAWPKCLGSTRNSTQTLRS